MQYTAPVTASPAPTDTSVQAAPVASPPKPRSDAGSRLGTQVLVIAAGLVILIASFAVGALVNGLTSSRNDRAKKAHAGDEATASVAAAPAPTNAIADLNLVPATSAETFGAATTLPPLVDPDHKYQQGYEGGDATAMSSQEYARMAQQPPPMQPAGTVNPLTIPPQPATAAPMPVPAATPKPRPSPPQQVEPSRRVERTEARPVSQPLPSVDTSRLRHDVTLRFNLTIGADGRVKEIEVLKGAEGLTAKLISKIQSWRFKPATEDGQAVESHFPVDISFNAP